MRWLVVGLVVSGCKLDVDPLGEARRALDRHPRAEVRCRGARFLSEHAGSDALDAIVAAWREEPPDPCIDQGARRWISALCRRLHGVERLTDVTGSVPRSCLWRWDSRSPSEYALRGLAGPDPWSVADPPEVGALLFDAESRSREAGEDVEVGLGVE